MNLPRVVGIGVIGGVVVTWLAGASTPLRSKPTVPMPRAHVDDASAAALAQEISRLHDRLHPDVAPERGRNVFTFAGARSATADVPSAAAGEPPAPAASVPPLAPGVPDLTLAGMAEDPGLAGPVRTAVISGSGQLYLAKVGDVVADQYRVERLWPDAADLVDLKTGAALRLTLR